MKLTLTDTRNAAGRYCLPKRLSAVLLLILLILGLLSCGRSEGTGETSDTVTDKISETGGEDKVNISESAKKRMGSCIKQGGDAHSCRRYWLFC